MFVCSGSPLATRGGTTFGDVFLVKDGDVNVLTDGSNLDNEALLAHEARHAAQWAAFGQSTYVQYYAKETLKSFALTGDPGCANWFEFDAGPLEGGYTTSAGNC